MSEQSWIVGDPEEVRRRVHLWREATGMSYLIARFKHPEGPSLEMVVDQLSTFWALAGL